MRRALQPLLDAQQLGALQSLDQWVMPVAGQQMLQRRLNELAALPQTWAAMREIGVPRQTMRQALREAAAAPPLTLSQSLQTPLAEAWRPLYLGEAAPGRFAAVARLQAMENAAAVQAAVMCAASLALLLVRPGGMEWTQQLATLGTPAWTALLYLGLLASIVVVTLQAWGQQRVDAVRSAIVFGLEPVFAALTAWALLGERMGPMAIAGAALVIAALVLSQLQPGRAPAEVAARQAAGG